MTPPIAGKCRVRESYPEKFPVVLPTELADARRLEDGRIYPVAWISEDKSFGNRRVAIRVSAGSHGGMDVDVYDGQGPLASFALDVYEGSIQLVVDDLKTDDVAIVRFPDPPVDEET